MDIPVKHPEVAAIFTRLLSELRLSGNQLARALGTSQQVISGYASGRTNPGREMIAAIIQRYPAISAAWLVTGLGDPFPVGRFNEKPTPHAAELLPAQQHDYTIGPGTVNTVVETQFLAAGVSLDAVSKVLGHSSVLMTQQVYCTVTSDIVAREFAKAYKDDRAA